MSLLSQTTLTSTSHLCFRAHLSSLFHSSACNNGGGTRERRSPSSQGGSRTRLTNTLNAGSKSGNSLEIAPRSRKPDRSAFERESLPHSEPGFQPRIERGERNSNMSFRRRSVQRSDQDWSRRSGRWESSKESFQDILRPSGDRSGPRSSSQAGMRSGDRAKPRETRSHQYEGSSRPRSYADRSKSSSFTKPQHTERYGDRAEPRETRSSQYEGSSRPRSYAGRSESSSFNSRHAERYGHGDRKSVDEYPRTPDRGGYSRRSEGSKPYEPRSFHRNDNVEDRQRDTHSRDSNSLRMSPKGSAEDATPPSESSSVISPPTKTRNHLPLLTEFYHPPPSLARTNKLDQQATPATQESQLETRFTSPPLLPGLLSCLTDILGPGATPTPIQALSLKWLLNESSPPVPAAGEAAEASGEDAGTAQELGKSTGWKQFLLASETGSGKSIAYLLPVLQALKNSELQGSSFSSSPQQRSRQPAREYNPRALILAPTHELSRQLSGFAKALLHEVKLRVLCASRANVRSTKERDGTARQMVGRFDDELRKGGSGEFEVRPGGRSFPVDLVVGTPMKLLEMVRGRGWDRKEDNEHEAADEGMDGDVQLRRGRDKMPGVGKWRATPEMGLANVEWVVVDEADVLFDPDFQETTRQLLADISAARGTVVPFTPESELSAPAKPSSSSTPSTTDQQPIDYPFNLILTSATIPSALAVYLDKHHPKLMRLASPNLHHLPKTLQTEYVNWTGGNKFADIERRIRRVWAEDSSFRGGFATVDGNRPATTLSKVLIFCNRSAKVHELGEYLEEKKIRNVALTSTSEQRRRGSNHHLDGFLRKSTPKPHEEPSKASASEQKDVEVAPAHRSLQPLVRPAESLAASLSPSNPKEDPHVMITTSLLSRGLDFSPDIRHVFIVDEPRNMVDFLHRAGRSGRAGERGKVIVFGKMKGRGSASAKDVRKRVGTLVA